jgi:hypothetical protein
VQGQVNWPSIDAAGDEASECTPGDPPDVSRLLATAAVGASTGRLKHSRLLPPDLAAPRAEAQPSPVVLPGGALVTEKLVRW